MAVSVYISFFQTHGQTLNSSENVAIETVASGTEEICVSERKLATYPSPGLVIDTDDAVNTIFEPKLSTEMGKTGSFEFYIYPNNFYYDRLVQMVTMLRVEDDGETIFYGRVLTIDDNYLSGELKIHCEGYLGVLMDSPVEGKPDADREETTGAKYVKWLIDNHNSHFDGNQQDQNMIDTATVDLAVPKKIYRGEVPGHYDAADSEQQVSLPDDYRYGEATWTDTLSAFSNLVGDYGGYLRTRYKNGKVYLDYLDMYFDNSDSAQKPIMVAENVLALESTTDVDNLFTYLIPVGSKEGESIYLDGYEFTAGDTIAINPNSGPPIPKGTTMTWNYKFLRVCDIISVGGYSLSDLNARTYQSARDYLVSCSTYGVIYKTVKFDDCDTKEKLWESAWEYIRDNYHGSTSKFTATALDLGLIEDGVYKRIRAGDRINLGYIKPDGSVVNVTRTVISVDYDLIHPENNQYTIGIPSGVLNNTTGSSSNSNSSSTQAATNTTTDDIKDDLEKWKTELEAKLWAHFVDNAHNKPAYEEYRQKYGDEAAASIQTSAVYTLAGAVEHDPKSQRVFNTMVLDAHDGKISLNRPKWGPFAGVTDQVASATKALSSLVIDGFHNALTFKEQTAITRNNFTSWTKEPKPIIRMGLRGHAAPSNSDPGVPDQSDTETPDSNNSGFMKLFNVTKSGSSSGDSSQNTAAIVDGFKSTVASIRGLFTNNIGPGMDNSVEDPENNPSSVDINGADQNGEGTIKVGRSGNRWRVLLNGTSQWQGTNGQWYTAPGFVIGDDFAIPDEIPSFSTKLAVIDTALIGQAYIDELNALKAKIQRLTGVEIFSSTRISASKIRATEILAGDIHLRQMDTSPSLWNVYQGLYKVENSDGSITIKGRLLTGSIDPDETHWVTFSAAGTLVWEWGDGDLEDEDSLPINTLSVTSGKQHQEFVIEHTLGYVDDEGEFIRPTAANLFQNWKEIDDTMRYETDVRIYHNQHIIADVPIYGAYPYNQGHEQGIKDAPIDWFWGDGDLENEDSLPINTLEVTTGYRHQDFTIEHSLGYYDGEGEFVRPSAANMFQNWTETGDDMKYETDVLVYHNQHVIASVPIYGAFPYNQGHLQGIKDAPIEWHWGDGDLEDEDSLPINTLQVTTGYKFRDFTIEHSLGYYDDEGDFIRPTAANQFQNWKPTGDNMQYETDVRIYHNQHIIADVPIYGAFPYNQGHTQGLRDATITGIWGTGDLNDEDDYPINTLRVSTEYRHQDYTIEHALGYIDVNDEFVRPSAANQFQNWMPTGDNMQYETDVRIYHNQHVIADVPIYGAYPYNQGHDQGLRDATITGTWGTGDLSNEDDYPINTLRVSTGYRHQDFTIEHALGYYDSNSNFIRPSASNQFQNWKEVPNDSSIRFETDVLVYHNQHVVASIPIYGAYPYNQGHTQGLRDATITGTWGDGGSGEDDYPVNTLRVTTGYRDKDFTIEHTLGYLDGNGTFVRPTASNQFQNWKSTGDSMKYETDVRIYHNQHIIADVPIYGAYPYNQGHDQGLRDATITGTWGTGDLSNEDDYPVNTLRVSTGYRHQDFAIEHAIGYLNGNTFVRPSASNQFQNWKETGDGMKYETDVRIYYNQHIIADVPIYGSYPYEQGYQDGLEEGGQAAAAPVSGEWDIPNSGYTVNYKYWNTADSTGTIKQTPVTLQLGSDESHPDNGTWNAVTNNGVTTYSMNTRMVSGDTVLKSRQILGIVPYNAGKEAAVVSGEWNIPSSGYTVNYKYWNTSNKTNTTKQTPVTLQLGSDTDHPDNGTWNAVTNNGVTTYSMNTRMVSGDTVLKSRQILGNVPYNAGFDAVAFGTPTYTKLESTKTAASATITVPISKKTDGTARSKDILVSLNSTTYKDSSDVSHYCATATYSNTVIARINIDPVYNAGRYAGIDAVAFGTPTGTALAQAYTLSATGTVSVPISNKSDGTARSKSISISLNSTTYKDSSNVSHYCATATYSNTVIARINIDPVYNAGFNAVAFGTPTGTALAQAYTLSASGTVSVPISNKTDGTARSTSISISLNSTTYKDSSDVSHYCATATYSNTVIARINIDPVYNAGFNAVTFGTVTGTALAQDYTLDSSGEVVIPISKKTDGTARSKTVSVDLISTTYKDTNKVSHYCATAKYSNTVIARINIDPVYNAGFNAVAFGTPTYTELGASVLGSTGTITVPISDKSDGTARTKNISLTLAYATFKHTDNLTHYCATMSYSSKVVARIRMDVAYNAGAQTAHIQDFRQVTSLPTGGKVTVYEITENNVYYRMRPGYVNASGETKYVSAGDKYLEIKVPVQEAVGGIKSISGGSKLSTNTTTKVKGSITATPNTGDSKSVAWELTYDTESTQTPAGTTATAHYVTLKVGGVAVGRRAV